MQTKTLANAIRKAGHTVTAKAEGGVRLSGEKWTLATYRAQAGRYVIEWSDDGSGRAQDVHAGRTTEVAEPQSDYFPGWFPRTIKAAVAHLAEGAAERAEVEAEIEKTETAEVVASLEAALLAEAEAQAAAPIHAGIVDSLKTAAARLYSPALPAVDADGTIRRDLRTRETRIIFAMDLLAGAISARRRTEREAGGAVLEVFDEAAGIPENVVATLAATERRRAFRAKLDAAAAPADRQAHGTRILGAFRATVARSKAIRGTLAAELNEAYRSATTGPIFGVEKSLAEEIVLGLRALGLDVYADRIAANGSLTDEEFAAEILYAKRAVECLGSRVEPCVTPAPEIFGGK